MTVVQEILDWSTHRPAWQRDALRRLFLKGKLDDRDLDELVLIAKEQHAPAAQSGAALRAESLAANQMPPPATTERVSLDAITDVRNVNALAQEQKVPCRSDGLTVVYGDNATGKSGYVRVLKKVCRARAADTPILSNVFDRPTIEPPRATINFSVGTTPEEFAWEEGSPSPDDLAAVSVFDSPSAAVYVNRTNNDVAYVPLGLDLLTKLAEACDSVGAKLREQITADSCHLEHLPADLAETPSGKWLKSITKITSVQEIDDHVTVSDQETEERERLRKVLSEKDPVLRAAELELQVERFEKLRCHLLTVSEAVTTAHLKHFRAAHEELRDAESASALATAVRFGNLPVPAVGTAVWERLWKAAGEFREEIHAQHQEETLEDPARCPLCQQPLDEDAKARFKAFADHFLAKAESDIANKGDAFSQARDVITGPGLAENSYRQTIEEVRIEHPSLASRIDGYLAGCRDAQRFVEAVLPDAELPKAPDVPDFDAAPLVSITASLSIQTKQLRAASDPEKSRSISTRALELEAKRWHAAHRDEIVAEVERRVRRASMERAVSDTVTTGITQKSTELTQRYVTDELRAAFGRELENLTGESLNVELVGQPGMKGISYYRLELSGATLDDAGIESVLSEGELRTISLAAFLSELSTEETKSAVVLDDPISSLDVWSRDRVAERVSKLASERQVIVFTHSLGFLVSLLEQARHHRIASSNLMLVKTDAGAGVVTDDFPAEAQKFKGLIGKLRDDCKTARGGSAKSEPFLYAAVIAKICTDFRKAVERGVEEVLLCEVVGRYQRQLRLTKILRLSAIDKEDVELLDRLMTKYSSYEHTQTSETRSPLPGIDEVERDVDSLAGWAKAFHKKAGT